MPLYEKYITVIYALGSAHEDNAVRIKIIPTVKTFETQLSNLFTVVYPDSYGQLTLPTKLIKPNYLVILPTDAAPQFLYPHESATALTSHSATNPDEFNVVCRSKPDLPNKTDSNTARLQHLTHQLGSAHEWSGVWNGP